MSPFKVCVIQGQNYLVTPGFFGVFFGGGEGKTTPNLRLWIKIMCSINFCLFPLTHDCYMLHDQLSIYCPRDFDLITVLVGCEATQRDRTWGFFWAGAGLDSQPCK